MNPVTSRARRYRISLVRPDVASVEGAEDGRVGAQGSEPAAPGLSLAQVSTAIEEMQLGALDEADGAAAGAGSAGIRELGNQNHPAHTLVARLAPEAKANLEKRYGSALKLLDDEIRLDLLGALRGQKGLSKQWSVANNDALGAPLRVIVFVTDSSGLPIEGATVTVEGALWVDVVVTDHAGQARLELVGESTDTLDLLEVNSPGHWNQRIERPILTDTEPYSVSLVGHGDLTNEEVTPWGIEALGADDGAPTAISVRIAIVDTGIDGEHSDLDVGPAGLMTSEPASGSDGPQWLTDEVGHGTHVAGTIAALANGRGVRGVAGGAVEIYSLKIFPSPRISSLIEAVDWCIDHDIDLINLSVGVDADDEGMEDAMARAREAGCVPIAAAGNTGGSVLSPARLDDVVAVSAVGAPALIQAKTTHSNWLEDPESEGGAEGYVPARFTCRGEEIDLCAPGVGILSTVPGGAWAAKDGTSMACPHIVGVAARLLSGRADIWGMQRSRARSDAIVALLMASAVDVGLPGELQGAGMPQLGPNQEPGGKPTQDGEKSAVDHLFETFLQLVGERLQP